MDATSGRRQSTTGNIGAARTTVDDARGATLVAELLARRWVVPILATLHDRPQRRFQLAIAVRGVSAKVLTETLRYLEAEGLVERRLVQNDDAVGAGYALTGRGDALHELVLALAHWWSSHELGAGGRETRTG